MILVTGNNLPLLCACACDVVTGSVVEILLHVSTIMTLLINDNKIKDARERQQTLDGTLTQVKTLVYMVVKRKQKW